MKLKIPKIDLFPGRDDDGLILALLIGAGVFIGTGVDRFSQDRWRQGGMGFLAAVSALTGKALGERRGERRGFDRGFNTYNPLLHLDELVPFDGSRDVPDVSGFRGGEPDAPSVKPSAEVVAQATKRKVERLEGKTVRELKELARERGLGGTWLGSARKREIIQKLLKNPPKA